MRRHAFRGLGNHYSTLLTAAAALALALPACAPGAGPDSSSIREWRARRGLNDTTAAPPAAHGSQSPGNNAFLGCCREPWPGRWCCRDGVRCCPPKAMPRREPARPVAMPVDAPTQPDVGRGRELAVLVEEAIGGLLGTCWPLHVAGRGLDERQTVGWGTVTVPAAANLRAAAALACRRPAIAATTTPGNFTQAQRETQCIRLFAEAAVKQALLPRGDTGSLHRRAVYLATNPDAVAVCTPVVLGLRGELGRENAEDGAVCGSYASPPLAFRWLKSIATEGPHVLIPRHPQGQVLVSDEYRFIFVHVPKAGSTTVRALLWERGGIDNLILSSLDLHRRSTYLTFAFVRDPLRRFVSAYDEVCLKLGPTCAFYDDKSPQGLRDFLAYTRAHPCWDEHVCSQMSFLVGEDGQMIRLDVIAATEHLVPTMTHISTVLEFDPPLSPESLAARNQGSRDAALNQFASDSDIMRGVCALYAIDYSCLGFTRPAVCRNLSLRSLDQAPGMGEAADGAAKGGTVLPGRDASTDAWAHNRVYPVEWHDTDVGLPAVVHDLQLPTVELIDALERHPFQCPPCSMHQSLLLSRQSLHENSTVGDTTVHPTSDRERGGAAGPRSVEHDVVGTEASGTCRGAERRGTIGGLEDKAGTLRGFMASTLIRLNLDKELLLPCCSAKSPMPEQPSGVFLHDPQCDTTSRVLCSVAGSSCKRDCADEFCARPPPFERSPGAGRPHGVHRAWLRKLVKEANSLPLSRKYGALWARAVTMQWLWRPHTLLVSAALEHIEALPQGRRFLKGEHVVIVAPTCPHKPVGDKYPHVTEDPCSMEQGWRDGRLDSAPENACYSTEHAAKCAFKRAAAPHTGCTSVAHYRLQHFLLAAQQLRATAPEAGQLDLAVVITDDSAIRDAAQDSAWLASHPSWKVVVFFHGAEDAVGSGSAGGEGADTAEEEEVREGENRESSGFVGEETMGFVGALLLMRHALHLVGSPASNMFQVGIELSVGLRFTNAALRHRGGEGEGQEEESRNGRGRAMITDWEVEAGMWEDPLMRIWSVDVPMAAGSFGLLGANIRPTSRLTPAINVSEISQGHTPWGDGLQRDQASREVALGVAKKAALECDGDRLSVAQDGDCSFQLMVDREYLPAQPVLDAARQRGSLGDPLTADLEARIRALQQTPEACVRGRRAYFPNHGAAATMNYLIIQLKRALRDQRPVKFTGTWIYAGCPLQDVSCIFLPETVCNISSFAREDEEARDWAFQSHGVYETLGGEGRGGVYPERIPETDPDFVLPLYRTEGKGMFWYNSVITGYVFRLVPAMSERVQEEIRHLGLDKASYVGVQIRRGDACGQTRPCIGIDLYSEAVVRLTDTYGIKLVYLATDDPDAIAELLAALHVHDKEIKVVGQRLDRQFMASNTEQCANLANEGTRTLNFDRRLGCEWIEDKLKRATASDKLAQSLGVVIDIEILARASAFVGTFTSALNRVAFQLSFARRGFVKPYISLDIPWCWAGFHLIQVPWGTYGC